MILQNGGLEYLTHESPDVLCLQETKCAEDDLPTVCASIEAYYMCKLYPSSETFIIAKPCRPSLKSQATTPAGSRPSRRVTVEWGAFVSPLHIFLTHFAHLFCVLRLFSKTKPLTVSKGLGGC